MANETSRDTGSVVPENAMDASNQMSSASSSTVSAQDPDENFTLSKRGTLIFVILAVLTLMAALDGTSISVALPIISKELNGTAIEAFWSGTSFLLSSTVFQPSFASFSNIFGRRPVILVAIALFLAGAIISGVSNDFTHLLVGRSIQGVGGGGIIALTEVVVTDIVPLRHRGQYFGVFSGMWAIGSVSGPILGGAFSQNVTWRWIFYINFPFIGVGVVMVLVFMRLNMIPSSLKEKLRKVDYIGTIIFVASMTSFLIPLTWGGVSYPWSSWHTLVPLIIGFVGLCFFGYYEHRYAVDPVIPPSIFKNRTATVSFIGSTLQGLVLWCTLYYLPLYYEAVKGYSPILSGVALFPETFTVAPSAMAVGIISSKTGSYRWAIWLGWAFSTIGCGIMCLIKVNTSVPGWVFLNLVAGLGLGFLFPSLGFAIQASSTNENLATAVAMFSFFRALGQALGVAVGGAIFQNRMYQNLLKYPEFTSLASEYSSDSAALVQIIKAMPDNVHKLHLREAYTDSLTTVWAVCCGVSAVGLLLSFFTKAYDLNQALVATQGLQREKDAPMEEELSQ
ncbi:major facilitator superfamily domain-containing protein [Penicillium cinerascens]|uniref:Major facilitator superfamily domain-containing protein n=1 Tax=Penicillium cinerascens TaxID=70096 RepID=A0A9W9JKG4_9EURO|nr:major facilitator superfamily domain-containing protein [Penicillium cinerascens]KAJ5198558.1 major facilitator superfamily domain-containing protein [Penicillium cinerascens]